MNTRTDGPVDWRTARPGEHILPQRVTTPDAQAASLEAFRSAPAIRREYWRGFRHGWVTAIVVVTLLIGAVEMLARVVTP